MAIHLKSPRDLDAMRRAGAMLRGILDDAIVHALPGWTTAALDVLIRDQIIAAGAEPVFQLLGFPGTASITVNEEAAHSPPGPRLLRPGDVVTIDAALRLDRWLVDGSLATVVGDGDPEAIRLVTAAREATRAACEALLPGRRWSEAAAMAGRVARDSGCSVLPGFAGHGIGREFQEPPVAAFGGLEAGDGRGSGQEASACQDFVLRPGMVFTVEPLVVLGRPDVLGLDDGWTVVTADRSAAAHEERTVAVTWSGARDLTAP